ncbi:MAG: YceI family protein [Acidobacteriaceae bacterium]
MLLSRLAPLGAALVLLANTPAPAAYGQAGPAPATNISLHFDPAGTQIRFTVKSLLHDARGTFKLKGGALAVDPKSGLAQGEILVDATTGKTGSKSTDRRLQKEVLESDRYPSIFFHAEHLEGELPHADGSADITAVGTLNIHGADHPEQIKLHLMRSGNSFTATSHFTVPYVAWGMKDPSNGLAHYSKEALVNVSAKGTLDTVPVKHETPATQSSDSDEEPPR